MLAGTVGFVKPWYIAYKCFMFDGPKTVYLKYNC